jgi:hypothetical protein
VLQTKRIKYYRNETDPACLLCGAAEENVPHFILQCEKLQSERVALLSEINTIWQNEFQNNENFTVLSEVDQLQLLMDNTINVKPTKKIISVVLNAFCLQHVCPGDESEFYWNSIDI